MAAVLFFHIFVFLSLFPFSLYHLVSSTFSFFKSPPSSSSSSSYYIARIYYPLPLPHHPRLRHLPLHFALLSLLLALLLLPFLPSSISVLSLQPLPALLLLFLLLLFLLLSPLRHHLHSPSLLFLLLSLSLFLLSRSLSLLSSSFPVSDLQSPALALSSLVLSFSSASALALSLSPRLFLAELSLASSLALSALWSLHSALLLYLEPFVPSGCHLLLPPSPPTTRCDLSFSLARAAAILHLSFSLHAVLVALIVLAVYAFASSSSSSSSPSAAIARRNNGGSYEALPTSSSSAAAADLDHVQMKALSKSSAQA